MLTTMVAIALVIVLLLAVSAFFSGSETALTGANPARLHLLAKGGDKRAARAERLIAIKDRVVSSILIGNNLVNILASALATMLFSTLFGGFGVVVATVVMTVLVVVFAEVLPKTYALRVPEALALRVSGPLSLLTALFAPLTYTLGRIISFLLPEQTPDEDEGEEALRGAIALHATSGDAEDEAESQMLGSILDLEDVAVDEIMTHRSQIESLDLDQSNAALIDAVLQSTFTRLPVWRDQPDNIVGILHAKNLFRALRKAGGDPEQLDISAIVSTPWFVPGTASLLEQLQHFRSRREHFALVVDEYGGLEGVVTLEDILEEIVGDIDDEEDEVRRGIQREAGGSFIIDGEISLRDLNRNLGWGLPDDRASTLAGFVLYESRQIPEVGQVLSFQGFQFEILGRDRLRITRLRVTPESVLAQRRRTQRQTSEHTTP